MTIAEAKQVRIVDFLAQLGHHAQHIKSEQYWYFSPLRNERTPSFKVNDRINEWYDFGEATGGDLVELTKNICRNGQRERGIGVYREACEWRISTENPYADRSTPTGGG